MLAVFNRTISLALFEEFGKELVLMNVNTVRSIIKPPGYKGRLVKEDVPMALEKHFGIKFPFYYKKTGKIMTESYDVADAIAVATAYTLQK